VDFIERYFGFSPDHGGGSLEAIILIMLVSVVDGTALAFLAEHGVRE
jgi:hypothetical protein